MSYLKLGEMKKILPINRSQTPQYIRRSIKPSTPSYGIINNNNKLIDYYQNRDNNNYCIYIKFIQLMI